MTQNRFVPLALLATLLMGASLAAAQAPPGKPAKVGKPGKVAKNAPPADMVQKVRERVRMMRMWKMTELLELDEATAAKLFPLLRTYDDKAEPLHKQAQATRQELRKAITKQLDDKTATAL